MDNQTKNFRETDKKIRANNNPYFFNFTSSIKKIDERTKIICSFLAETVLARTTVPDSMTKADVKDGIKKKLLKYVEKQSNFHDVTVVDLIIYSYRIGKFRLYKTYHGDRFYLTKYMSYTPERHDKGVLTVDTLSDAENLKKQVQEFSSGFQVNGFEFDIFPDLYGDVSERWTKFCGEKSRTKNLYDNL